MTGDIKELEAQLKALEKEKREYMYAGQAEKSQIKQYDNEILRLRTQINLIKGGKKSFFGF